MERTSKIRLETSFCFATAFSGVNINPNVAQIFGPKALRSLYIRPSRDN
jgi:hypothetical protein